MARDVEADVNINDKSSRGLRSFLTSLKRADDEAKKTQKDLDKVSASTGKLGKSSSDSSKAIGKLSDELGIARHELGSLALAFGKTSDAAERMDLAKVMRKQQAEIRNLAKNSNILKDFFPEQETQGFAKKFVGTITQAFSGIPIGPVLVGAAVAAAPFLGAAISAGVIGGASAGGLIGGVILASKDPRVAAAGKNLGTNLLSSLRKDADVFVEPLLRNIGKVEARFGLMNTRISHIFANSSKFLDPIVDGALNGIDGILRGIDSLVSKGGPVMASFGRTFDVLGNSIGDAFETISGGSDEAADALDDFTNAAAFSIQSTGVLVRTLTELYGAVKYISPLGEKMVDWLSDESKKSQEAATQTGGLSQQLRAGVVVQDQYGHAIQTTGSKMATLEEQMRDVYDVSRNLFDAETDAAEAFDSLKKSIGENGKTLDIHTAKGRANRTALSNLVGVMNSQYKAYVDVNGQGIKANGIASSNYNSFIKAAAGLGISKRAAQEYATKLGLIPPKKNTDFHANTHDAEARAKALKAKIDAIKSKTVTVHVSVTGTERLDSAGHRIGGYRAAGGPVAANTSYIVGERGPEVLTMGNTGGNITPNHALGGGDVGGDMYLTLDLGRGIEQRIKIENKDLKRRATQKGPRA
jgi:hypothetical protein